MNQKSHEEPDLGQAINHKPLPTPISLYVIAIAIPCIVLALVSTQTVEMQAQMFRDTFRATLSYTKDQSPPTLGLVSNFGIVLWCAAWAVTGFAAIAKLQSGINQVGLLLLTQSLISGLLLADDFLMMHEKVYPSLFGIGEIIIYIAYIMIVLGWVTVFRKQLCDIGLGLLIIAGLFFAVSIVGDIIDHYPNDLGIIQRWLEDATKLIGISFWTMFALRASWVHVVVSR